jgi:cysteine-rich repeat protein
LSSAGLVAGCGGGTADDGDGGDWGEATDGDEGEAVVTSCGDGILDIPDEECDRGARNSDTEPDACRTDCRRPWCGDGVVDRGEACDDGNDNDTDDCTSACRLPSCGNGVVDPGEACDDGNDSDTDDCPRTCLDPFCGDGFVWAGHEECDSTTTEPCTTSCGSIGVRACAECRRSDACAPPDETCNGADDDCDTVADDGFACVRGAPVACTSVCGAIGTGICGDRCAFPEPEECSEPPEVCNARDDDCDGEIDEDFACVRGETVPCETTCGSAGRGACSPDCGVPTSAMCLAPAEACNGRDDDCDTSVDEGLPCAAGRSTACTTTCGTIGTGICTAACEPPVGGDCTPPSEACNGRDDDCDTSVDEDLPCIPGATTSCTTICGSTGTGTCTSLCQPPSGSACTPPSTETCNGRDDDCDTLRDEGFACIQGDLLPCTTPCGTTGVGPCHEDCTPPGYGVCVAPDEACNGRDDDCDTMTDETFPCARLLPTPCITSCGSVGTGTCSSACALPPTASCTVPAEICNGTDDDCDRLTDEGFPCRAGGVASCTTICGSTGSSPCNDSCEIADPTVCDLPAERCNAADDDCDTVPDDGFECVRGATGSCTVGTCTGTRTCQTSCTWNTCAFGTAPGNNSCSSSSIPTLSNTDGTSVYRGTNCSATDSFTASCDGTAARGPDVVYRLILSVQKVVTLDTLGSDYGAVLFLRIGTTCDSATQLACDAGSAGGDPPQAHIERMLEAGTYWVVIDGIDTAARGSYALNVTIAEPVRPANDMCAGAVPLELTSTLQSVSGDTTTALGDNTACAGTGGRDVWYTFTLATRTAVFLSTQDGNTWDSVLHVRAGSCSGALTAYGCADNACSNARSLFVGILPAGAYYVAVDGRTSVAYGPYTLYYQGSTCVDPLDATPATATVDPLAANGTYAGTTVGAGNDSTGTCIAGIGQNAPDVYYYLGLCPGRTLSFSTCDSATRFDTVLYARFGTCLDSSGPDIACNNNPSGSAVCPLDPPGAYSSGIWFGSSSQGLYYVFVDGDSNGSAPLPEQGPYGLLVSGF